jgi:hypothetical protein
MTGFVDRGWLYLNAPEAGFDQDGSRDPADLRRLLCVMINGLKNDE